MSHVFRKKGHFERAYKQPFFRRSKHFSQMIGRSQLYKKLVICRHKIICFN